MKATILRHLLCLSVLILLLSACGTRKAAIQKETRTRTLDSTAHLQTATHQVDTGSTYLTNHQEATHTVEEQTTIYPTKGQPFTLALGKSFTGMADSVKNRVAGQTHLVTAQEQSDHRALVTDSHEKSITQVKAQTEESSKTKQTDKEDMTAFWLGGGIIVLALLFLLVRWLYHRYLG